MLYHIPIEPYETRYTADWVEQFEYEFNSYGVPFKTILGTQVSTTIGQEGNVLDAVGTSIYKTSQMDKILKLFADNKIKDSDVFFFSDLWFPSIETLFYIRNLTGIKFKIAGILHAGTYDTNDFTFRSGMRKWGKHLENCWLSEIDFIFVATHYHKELIQQHSSELGNIYVTGIPFYADKLQEKYSSFGAHNKENIVVFPHRVAREKHPELFDQLAGEIKLRGRRDIQFVKSIEETDNRDEYFNLLCKSKVTVSFAEQETFGYSMLEALALNNVVLAPRCLSYVETLPDGGLYKPCEPISVVADKVIDAIDNFEKFNPVGYKLNRWSDSIGIMLSILKSEGVDIYGV